MQHAEREEETPNLQILAASTSTTTHICRPAYIYILRYTHSHTHMQAHTSAIIRYQITRSHPIHSSNPPPSSITNLPGSITNLPGRTSITEPTHPHPTHARATDPNVSPTQFSHLPHISHPNVTPAAKHPMLSQISSSSSSSIAASLAPIPPPIIPADLTTLSHTHTCEQYRSPVD